LNKKFEIPRVVVADLFILYEKLDKVPALKMTEMKVWVTVALRLLLKWILNENEVQKCHSHFFLFVFLLKAAKLHSSVSEHKIFLVYLTNAPAFVKIFAGAVAIFVIVYHFFSFLLRTDGQGLKGLTTPRDF
jgi:hypothetical protein